MSLVRDHWRILLLVVLLVVSGFGLFAPSVGGGTGDSTDITSTNLEYGLELSGGTRIRAPLVGVTAEDVAVTPENDRQVATTVARELGVSRTDVKATPRGQGTGTVEVFSKNVSQEAMADALRAADLEASTDNVRDGVTQDTRDTVVAVLQEKVNQAGLSGGTVQTVRTADETYVLLEVPNKNRSEVVDLVDQRGEVELVGRFPAENGSGYRNVTLLTQQEITDIGTAQPGGEGQAPRVPVSVKSGAPAENFSATLQRYGYTDQGLSRGCTYRQNPQDPGYCLLAELDGRVVYASSLGADLARLMESGEWVKDPSFVIEAGNFSEARQLQINLQAGALPTTLDLQSGTTQFVLPSLAEEFKLFSLVTGIIAMLAVSGVVSVRYRDFRVAAPMLVTALSEVFILLGFAAAVGLALDLSHIAGFIAVIGTGVDDLIIIADEILQRGDIRTGRVFKSRFRKAFWVIGAAAATTIVAMSPLAVLSLGDLQGFAIVTIVGVLVGVLVTRPAYGDILQTLMTN